MVDIKNVESAGGDTSQDERKSSVDESVGGEPTPSFVGKFDDIHGNEVHPLQAYECYEESLSEISEQKRGGVTLKLKLSS